MSNVTELNNEDLEKVSGGGNVTDVVEGGIYRHMYQDNLYIKVFSFCGWDVGSVMFHEGKMQSDGKIHRIDYSAHSWFYNSVKENYDIDNPVDSSLWDDSILE